MTSQKLIDPITIAQLGNLQLRARRLLDGLYSGRHINKQKGNSKEFSQHRPYYVGDDLKTLDWKVFGRTDRLVIKQYQEETNIVGTAIIDDSASMNFSHGGRISKLEYVKTLAAALGYLLVLQHDAVGLHSSNKWLAPNGSRGHLEEYFKKLESIGGKDIWDIDNLLKNIQPTMKKRGMAFIFSDLMSDAEKLVSTFRSLHARKIEVIVFHVLDPVEISLDLEGSYLFEDSESRELLKSEPALIKAQYQHLMKARIAAFAQALHGSGIDYTVLTTDMPFEKGLGHYLSWRGGNS